MQSAATPPTPPARSLWSRLMRSAISGTLTLAVVAGAGFAVVSGTSLLAERADAVEAPPAAPIATVAVAPITWEEGYTVSRQFIGQIEAGRSADLAFELSGVLTEILVDEGDEVLEGQIIARLDTALLEAERSGLEASRDAVAAQLSLAETRLARALALRADGHVPQERVDAAQATRDELFARQTEILSSLNAIHIRFEKSELRAPFAGRVGALTADLGETRAPGQAVIRLIEAGATEMRVGLPLSLDASSLESATVTLAGSELPAELLTLRPDIDPVTRTRTALFALPTAPDAALVGQTATLSIDIDVSQSGAWVPLEALRESIGGAWSVLMVEDGIVRPATVEPLHSDGARVFVRGGFEDGSETILGGAHRLVPGQSVRTQAVGG